MKIKRTYDAFGTCLHTMYFDDNGIPKTGISKESIIYGEKYGYHWFNDNHECFIYDTFLDICSYMKYDDNGNLIYHEQENGPVCSYEYDEHNNIIKSTYKRSIDKTPKVSIYENTYDEEGNLISVECGGMITLFYYNIEGMCIKKEFPNTGTYSEYDYDEEGKCIFERVNGQVIIHEYEIVKEHEVMDLFDPKEQLMTSDSTIQELVKIYSKEDLIAELEYTYIRESLLSDVHTNGWDDIGYDTQLPYRFIKEFKDILNWENISKYQLLTDDMVREFAEYVNWGYIYSRDICSEDLYNEFKDKIKDSLKAQFKL